MASSFSQILGTVPDSVTTPSRTDTFTCDGSRSSFDRFCSTVVLICELESVGRFFSGAAPATDVEHRMAQASNAIEKDFSTRMAFLLLRCYEREGRNR